MSSPASQTALRARRGGPKTRAGRRECWEARQGAVGRTIWHAPPHPAAQPRRAFVTQPCHSDAPGMLCVHQACTGGALVLRESSAAFYSVLPADQLPHELTRMEVNMRLVGCVGGAMAGSGAELHRN